MAGPLGGTFLWEIPGGVGRGGLAGAFKIAAAFKTLLTRCSHSASIALS
jgi:hypothetical protein